MWYPLSIYVNLLSIVRRVDGVSYLDVVMLLHSCYLLVLMCGLFSFIYFVYSFKTTL